MGFVVAWPRASQRLWRAGNLRRGEASEGGSWARTR